MRHDVVVGVALVNARLEDLHALACDLRAPQPADQLFALAAEHRPAYHLDPSQIVLGKIHVVAPKGALRCPLSASRKPADSGERMAPLALAKNSSNSANPPNTSVAQPKIQPLISPTGIPATRYTGVPRRC